MAIWSQRRQEAVAAAGGSGRCGFIQCNNQKKWQVFMAFSLKTLDQRFYTSGYLSQFSFMIKLFREIKWFLIWTTLTDSNDHQQSVSFFLRTWCGHQTFFWSFSLHLHFCECDSLTVSSVLDTFTRVNVRMTRRHGGQFVSTIFPAVKYSNGAVKEVCLEVWRWSCIHRLTNWPLSASILQPLYIKMSQLLKNSWLPLRHLFTLCPD